MELSTLSTLELFQLYERVRTALEDRLRQEAAPRPTASRPRTIRCGWIVVKHVRRDGTLLEFLLEEGHVIHHSAATPGQAWLKVRDVHGVLRALHGRYRAREVDSKRVPYHILKGRESVDGSLSRLDLSLDEVRQQRIVSERNRFHVHYHQ